MLSMKLILVIGALGGAMCECTNCPSPSAGAPVVRRVSRLGTEDEESASEPAHCVVWGAAAPKGIKFYSKAEAEATFKAVKRTETVAAHYKGMVEVQRHLSPRLSSMSWRQLRKWCSEDHPNAEQPKLLQEDMRSNVRPKSRQMVELEPTRDDQPTFDRSRGRPPLSRSLRDDEDGEHQERDENYGRGRHERSDSNDDDASSQEQAPLEELPSRRDDDDDEHGAHRGQRDRQDDDDEHEAHRAHHDRQHRGHHASSLDDFARPPRAERSALDGMHGHPAPKRKRRVPTAQAASFGADSESSGHHGHNHGGHNHGGSSRDGHTPSFLGKAGVAARITSLSRDMGVLASEAADLAKRMGTQEEQPSSILLESDMQGMILKDRVKQLEGSLDDVNTRVSSLERQVLGRSGNLNRDKSVHGLRNQAASLEKDVTHMKDRMSALKKEMDLVAGQLDTLQENMDRLSSKATSLFHRIGNDNTSPIEPQQHSSQDASFIDRFNVLEGDAEKMQGSVDSLEAELRGTEAHAPPPRIEKTGRFSEKTKFLETHMKSMSARLTALELEI